MDVLRRKMGQVGGACGGEGVIGADRAWRLALARAARDEIGLALDVTGLRDGRASLAELVEMPAERSLIAVLDAAGGDALGLVALDPAVLAGLVGMLATGRISAGDGPRRPTRTDAAMVAPMLDGALAGLAVELHGQEAAPWAEGWRYASFLDEARPLALLLDETEYRVLRAEVSLMRGAATGEVLLALPAARSRPAVVQQAEIAAGQAEAFHAAFVRQVEAVACRIEAELARCQMPLARVMALGVGDVLPLGDATVSRLSLRGIDGQVVAEGKLGQMRGQRAVRLAQPQELRLAG
ncbi:flagellar switch protein FliM [Gemmobacter aquarius]|uniref:Flagellar switch protein FliM n=1 Tax=Paragemmobacter aquarius TaxID=2169400 RepID=A0A2S0ULT9_9RHOB|nr:flagellar motor switch protein FliM [Gemmobacter aquarius]AWB48778.1 flagellar switch protein FliM [Gemmobacter aquarius]